jgi:hypothetical protein
MTERWVTSFSLGLMTLMSIAIGLYALAFQGRMLGDPSFHMKFDSMPVASTMHVLGGAVVLLTGALQFWPGLRRSLPAFHRWTGRLYLTFVLIGGIGGLVLAPSSDGGVVAHFGFGMLAVLWLFSGGRAWMVIRAGKVQVHREWMMRNFAMTFAAVTLRIHLGLFAVAGIPFDQAYPAVAWLCWVPNLMLVEWYLAMKRDRGNQAAQPVSA